VKWQPHYKTDKWTIHLGKSKQPLLAFRSLSSNLLGQDPFRVACSFAARLQRLPAQMIGAWICKDHVGIDVGSCHMYAPCGCFDHDGMKHRHGFVRSVNLHTSSDLAQLGWYQVVLVYRPGGLNASFNPDMPDIGAPILIRDVGRTRYVCHLFDVLVFPLDVTADDAREEDEGYMSLAIERLWPSHIPETVGVSNGVVLGEWHHVADLDVADLLSSTYAPGAT